jgi:hypothetical protein
MSQRFKVWAMAVYGLAVVVNGLLSILLSREGGTAGIWFGGVMGTLALAASLLIWSGPRLVGTAVAWVVIAFVGGWFAYSTFVKKGLAQAEPRVLVILLATLLVVVVLCVPTKRQSATPAGS